MNLKLWAAVGYGLLLLNYIREPAIVLPLLGLGALVYLGWILFAVSSRDDQRK